MQKFNITLCARLKQRLNKLLHNILAVAEMQEDQSFPSSRFITHTSVRQIKAIS